MTRADLRSFLEFVRKKTLDTLDAIAKRPDAAELLALAARARAGPTSPGNSCTSPPPTTVISASG